MRAPSPSPPASAVRAPEAAERRHDPNPEESSDFPRPDRDVSQPASLLERLEHFTWAWFTVTMSTGGLAIVLVNLPLRFPGLRTLGLLAFFLNLVFFALNTACITVRFLRYKWTFIASLHHPTESLFVSAFLLSIATIVIGSSAYGSGHTGPWLVHAIRIVFWCYCALSLIFTVTIHIVIWSTQTHIISRMSPLWILPVYPMLLVGPMAGQTIRHGLGVVGRQQAMDILIAGLAFQGIGFMISLMIYSAYIFRLMTAKLPVPGARPGMFVSVGPSAFTVAGLVSLGEVAPEVLPVDFLGGDNALAGRMLELGTVAIGVWLWGLAIWFFLISVAANLGAVFKRRLHFSLGYWAFIFPNCGLTLATRALGRALESEAVNMFAAVLTVALVLAWILVTVMTARGVWKKQILWAGVAENRDEGGFRMEKRTTVARRRKEMGEA